MRATRIRQFVKVHIVHGGFVPPIGKEFEFVLKSQIPTNFSSKPGEGRRITLIGALAQVLAN